MSVVLKCGCSINDQGEWVFGEECRKKNCGECRLIASLHPFTPKRLADLVYSGVKVL